MEIHFSKYHGTGNDFILIDNRNEKLKGDEFLFFRHLCDRHTGIGGDGLILIENQENVDFLMRYYNADGFTGSFCGNGGRCAVSFARNLGIVKEKSVFLAYDGEHIASCKENEISVSLKKPDIIEHLAEGAYRLNTGSPHLVLFSFEPVSDEKAFSEGKSIRYSGLYEKEGINVNFVWNEDETWHLVTYERGVENLTLSCGTGTVAAALCIFRQNGNNHSLKLQSKGGQLTVSEEKDSNRLILTGPAVKVFDGIIHL
jgi:diaminopimelate epimerase